MAAIKQFLLDFSDLKIFDYLILPVFLVIFTEIIARAGMGAAFAYKKNKSSLKKDEAGRSTVKKIFGIYDFSRTNAPHHIKKYAVIRICNPISFILTIAVYFLVPYVPNMRIVFSVFILLHTLFLLIPQIIDAIVLSNTKKYGKMTDFDLSGNP